MRFNIIPNIDKIRSAVVHYCQSRLHPQIREPEKKTVQLQYKHLHQPAMTEEIFNPHLRQDKNS